MSRREKKVKFKLKSGEIKERTYHVISDNIYYWILKWTRKAGIELNPYFFRHNRDSDFLLNGGSFEDLMFLRGSKDPRSAMRYTHLSSKKGKEIAEQIG